MNETTLFLSQIFGPVLGLVGIGMLLNLKTYMKMVKEFTKVSASLMFSTMAMIAIGVVILNNHFLFGSIAEALITLIGFGFFAKGVLFAMFPKVFEKLLNIILSKGIMIFGASLWVLGGLYLSWCGYFV